MGGRGKGSGAGFGVDISSMKNIPVSQSSRIKFVQNIKQAITAGKTVYFGRGSSITQFKKEKNNYIEKTKTSSNVHKTFQEAAQSYLSFTVGTDAKYLIK